MPQASACFAISRQSAQLADHRSGTLVADRPDEQFAPNRPSLSALSLYIAKRSRIVGAERSSKQASVSCAWSLDVRPTERSFHLAANFHGSVVWVECHVGPLQALAFS